jgi:hypothetical protein
MRVFHRIAADLDERKDFLRVGIDLEDHVDSLTQYASSVVFRIEEADPRWSQVAKLVNPDRHIDLIETEFSDRELRGAQSVRFLSKSFGGYPEPSQDLGYRDLTYDVSEYCETCGTGLRQKAPFRLAVEPKWGRRETFQLHWVFDEIFVKPTTWEEVFKPFEIGYWPVLSKSGKEYSSVMQLRVDSVAELDMPEGLPRQACPTCFRVKYLPLSRGFWPMPLGMRAPIAKSSQYFGDGHAADRDMFVSHDLYVAMAEAKLNCRYWACQSLVS